MSPSAAPFRPRTAIWLGAGLMAAAYAAAAAFHVAYGPMNVDEGFYAAAARSVWRGQMPYRDFGFTQPPLVAYVTAPALALTHFGLFPQRTVDGLLGALAVLLAARLVWRRAGAGAALTLGAIFALTPGWLYFIDLGKTYGLTSLVVMGMTAVFLEWEAGWRRSLALSALAAIGCSCRLPAVPFFGLLWLAGLAAGRPTLRGGAFAAATLLLGTALLWLPFALEAPKQTWFWVYEFHRISVPNKLWHVNWRDLVGLAPAIWLAAAGAAGAAAVRRHGRSRELAVAAAAAAALAVNVLPGGAYQEYGVPFLPPLAASSLILLEPALAGLRRGWRLAGTAALLLGSVGLVPAIGWSRLVPAQRRFPSPLLPFSVPPYDFALPRSIAATRTLVQRLLPPGQTFIGPAVILAVEADRPVPPEFRMGAFTCTRDYDAATAARLHLATIPEFLRQLDDPANPLVCFFLERKFNYAWSVPSFTFEPPEVMDSLRWRMGEFAAVYSDRNFVIVARRPVLSR